MTIEDSYLIRFIISIATLIIFEIQCYIIRNLYILFNILHLFSRAIINIKIN